MVRWWDWVLPNSSYVFILHTMVYKKHTKDHWQGDAVAEALFGKGRREVLALLFGQGGEYYLRQVAERTGLAVRSVQRELARLVGAGLVERMERGNQVWFRADERSPVHGDLVGLMTKVAGVVGQLRDAMVPLAEEGVIQAAFLYGSLATGDQGISSDVDLMVIGDVALKELVPVLRPVEERIGREINPTIYPAAEMRRRVMAGEHFLTRVLGGPRQMLIGSDDELARLAGQSLAGLN